ncbi:MAG TPA: hypothetical protein VN688_06670, partial [Gemmataceae bacterium]|nr:hypothetical protein [Gemmataceae bacterium]
QRETSGARKASVDELPAIKTWIHGWPPEHRRTNFLPAKQLHQTPSIREVNVISARNRGMAREGVATRPFLR